MISNKYVIVTNVNCLLYHKMNRSSFTLNLVSKKEIKKNHRRTYQKFVSKRKTRKWVWLNSMSLQREFTSFFFFGSTSLFFGTPCRRNRVFTCKYGPRPLSFRPKKNSKVQEKLLRLKKNKN